MSTEIQPHDTTLYDGRAYAEESQFYQQKSDALLTRSDTLILVGFNCKLSVKHGTLQVQQGSTYGQDEKVTSYYRGTHKLRQIVILSTSGNLSLESLSWCKEQDIGILLFDGKGNLLYSLSPENNPDVLLRSRQYRASDTKRDVEIVRELVRRKTSAQLDVLKTLPERKRDGETIAERIGKGIVLKDSKGRLLLASTCKLLEDGLVELTHMNTLQSMQGLEARLAYLYWDAFVDIPLKWSTKDAKIVPPYWKVITERSSVLTGNLKNNHAINPFHAALNYLYAVTEHQLLQAVYIAGLDPMIGFLHVSKSQSLSLVYDLIEPLRPCVDAKVLQFFAATTLKRGDCVPKKDGGILFNPDFIRFLVASCRLEQQESDAIVVWLKQTLLGATL